jgi:hypothetical protein
MIKTFLICSVVGLVVSVTAAMAQSKPQTQQLSKQQLDTVKQMSDVYARHLQTSICLERQKALFIPTILSEQEKAKRIQADKAACECMTETIMQVVPPTDMIDYLTYNHGTIKSSPNMKIRELSAQERQKNQRIGMMIRDEKSRRNCGFKK